MKTNLHYVFFISLFLLTYSIFSQQNYWTESIFKEGKQGVSLKNLDKSNYKTYQLNSILFKEQLIGVPIRGQFSGKSNTIVSFPNENGRLESFRVIEAPVLSEELSVLYPNIKTYLGYSIDNSSTRIRFSVTPLGVNAMTSYTNKAACFLSPTTKISNGQYLVYNRKANLNTPESFKCLTESTNVSNKKNLLSSKDANDQILRTLRIAISTTGEYTNFWDDGNAGNGDAQEDALAQVVSTLNRTNEVFEVDMAVTFTLVTGIEIVYPDTATDPYGDSLNSELQNTLTSVVGETNYDIGHLFHFAGNNGNAGCIGCVCVDGQKGSGVSSHTFLDNDGGPNMSDFFDIDYVPHEIGHQMGANHTWSFQSEGTGVQSEPGSGTTIMSYAGITGSDDVQDHSDPYFHYHSIDQILNNLDTRTCWTSTPITNNPPIANAGNDYTIPQGTAFVLKGASTDIDGGDTHTYTWEQIDNGITNTGNFGPTKATGATWRSRPPSISPNRYMPILSRVVAGLLTETNPLESLDNSTWETVSTIGRDLNFALTVRDRSETGGIGQMPQNSFDLMKVTVENVTPFTMSAPNTAVTWNVGTEQTVTWNVGQTTNATINCQNVNIKLSLDGGLTYPIMLACNTPNDGTEPIVIPDNVGSNNRIMVEAADNIFYDISDVDFNIANPSPTFVLQKNNLCANTEVCTNGNVNIDFNFSTTAGFNEITTFSASNLPTGVITNFTPSSLNSNGSTTINLSSFGVVSPGDYTILVSGTSTSASQTISIDITVFDAAINPTTLTSPANGATDLIPPNTALSWSLDVDAQDYLVEIATDNGFSNIIESITTQSLNYTTTLLASNTQYYWRVTASNLCATATPSTVFNFTTANVSCSFFTATDTPITISASGISINTSTLSIIPDFPILDVNITLDIIHTFDGDLDISLTSPTGTIVNLSIGNGGSGNNYTNTVFDQEATNPITGGSPPYTGTFTPEGDLSTLNGEMSGGDWILTVADNFNLDGGSIEGFTLELCVLGTLSVNENRFDEFTVFPNPNNGEFTVRLNSNSSENIKISVYDITGRSVFSRLFKDNVSNFNQIIRLDTVQSGLYLINVSDGLKTQTKKIIIR